MGQYLQARRRNILHAEKKKTYTYVIKDEYIVVKENGAIYLTEKGKEIALKVYEKHQLIAKILISLGVSEKTAYEDSCKIEHNLSRESFEKIKEYYEKNIENKN